jgi:hypothetical protein
MYLALLNRNRLTLDSAYGKMMFHYFWEVDMYSMALLGAVIAALAFINGFFYGQNFQIRLANNKINSLIQEVAEMTIDARLEKHNDILYAYEINGVFLCQGKTTNDILQAFTHRFPHKILRVVEIEEGALAG